MKNDDVFLESLGEEGTYNPPPKNQVKVMICIPTTESKEVKGLINHLIDSTETMLTEEMMPAVRLQGLRDVSLQEIEKVTKT